MDNKSNIACNDYGLVPYSPSSSSSSSTSTSRSASPVSTSGPTTSGQATSGSTPPPLSPVTPLDPPSKHLRSRPIKPTNRFSSEGRVRKQGKKQRTRSNTKDIQKLSKSQLQKIVHEMLDFRAKVPRVRQREMDHQVVTGRAEVTDSTIEIIRSVPTEPLDYRSKSMRPNLYVQGLGRTESDVQKRTYFLLNYYFI